MKFPSRFPRIKRIYRGSYIRSIFQFVFISPFIERDYLEFPANALGVRSIFRSPRLCFSRQRRLKSVPPLPNGGRTFFERRRQTITTYREFSRGRRTLENSSADLFPSSVPNDRSESNARRARKYIYSDARLGINYTKHGIKNESCEILLCAFPRKLSSFRSKM